MKKLLFLLLILAIFDCSCSKKEQGDLGGQGTHDSTTIKHDTTAVIPLEYPIDLNFTNGAFCSISYDIGSDYPPLDERDFYFEAYPTANLPGDSLGLYIHADQSYSYYYHKYSTPTFMIHQQASDPMKDDDYFLMQPDSSDFNFFNLPAKNDSAFFSGTCHVTAGSGKYVNITRKITPLTFSGFIDTIHAKGSLRIKGSVYY